MDLALYPHFFWSADEAEYNCSNKTVEEWEKTGAPSPLLGAYFFTVGVVVMICYIVVIISMSDAEVLRQQCYKIMYFNCFIDFGNLLTNSVMTGVLFYNGSVFCSWPFASFFFGAIGLGCWCSSCFNCCAIGINRCCTMFNRFTGLFAGKLIYAWLVTSFCLLLFVMNFTRTPIFNSAMGAWFYYPFIDPIEEMVRIRNVVHPIVNIVTAFLITFLYGLLCCFMIVTKESVTYTSTNVSKAQHKVFVQSVVICISTCIAAYLYVYMQFFPIPPWLILVASIAYQMCSAIPCFVYLTLNSSVRIRARKLLRGQFPSTLTAKMTAITGASLRRPSRISNFESQNQATA